MDSRVDEDSDAPEEFTSQLGITQDEEIRMLQLQSKARVRREEKERRRKKAERLTPRPRSKGSDDEMVEVEEQNTTKQFQINKGMLPIDIVNMLAANEKQVFVSDSDEDKTEKEGKLKKKKTKRSGVETFILNKLPPTPCVENALEFMKQRRKQVPRSNSVLNNSNQALRLLSSSGLL